MLRIQKLIVSHTLFLMALAITIGGMATAKDGPQRSARARGSMPDFKNMPAPSLEKAQALIQCLEQNGMAKPPLAELTEEDKASLESCRQQNKSNRECFAALEIGPFARSKEGAPDVAIISAALQTCHQQVLGE